jgi:hypothetical protein
MPVIRRGIDDELHVLALEQPTKIGITLRRWPALDGEFLDYFGEMPLVDIAHRDDVTVICRIGGVSRALSAAANQCDAWTIIGRRRRALRLGSAELSFEEPQRQTRCGSERRASPKKRSSRDLK